MTTISASYDPTYRLLVSLLSTEKHEIPVYALESARLVWKGSCCCAPVPLGWWFLRGAEPDIHLRSEARKGQHRRSSFCSLPVPKQLEESLRSRLLRPAGYLRDVAVCASHRSFCFSLLRKGFYAAAVCLNSPAGRKLLCRLSTATICATSLRAPQPAWPCCRRLSAAPGRTAQPVPGCSWIRMVES